MAIPFTTDQVLALAPDTSSASAGKKLNNTRHWRNLGQNTEALWGECQGSALYQVRIDLSTVTFQCSCPSRKFPCKHGLGLLLLAVSDAKAAPVAEPPEWVVSWLAKRAATKKRQETVQEHKKTSEVPSAAQEKRAANRRALVNQGLNRLDLWLNDLVRNGLTTVESQPASFWEAQAAPMDDAQAAGLASRLRLLASIPNASPDWPERLLAQLGRIALLTHAYRQGEKLAAPLQEDVRQSIGWTLKQEEVAARGSRVTDDWLILGQWIENGDRGRTQRTWLSGIKSERPALLLQFSVAGQPFPESYLLGTQQTADLVFWPGAFPVRARIDVRHGQPVPLSGRLPGHETVADFLGGVATALASQPWQERFLCVLRSVTPILDAQTQRWLIRDHDGQALPLTRGEHWRLLALSGGHPIDFAGEWDGDTLRPLGIMVAGTYYLL